MAGRRSTNPAKMPNGRWKARYVVRDPLSGRQVRQPTKTFDFKWQADEWLDANRGRTAREDKIGLMSIATYADRYWSEIVYGLSSNQNIANFRGHLSIRVIPTLGDVRIGDLNSAMVERAQARWAVGVSRTVVMGTRSFLSRLCAHAIKQGVLQGNPVLSAKKPPRELRREVHTLARVEIDQLLGELQRRDELYSDLAAVAVLTGVRVGELLALRPSDVSFEDRVIRVQRAWSGTGRNRVLGPPKSGRIRSVPLPASLVPTLNRRIDVMGSRAESLWRGPRGSSLHHGNVIVRTGFKEIVTKMGHPEFVWHDLRATAIVGWLRSGVPLTVVRDWAGHASISTTDRYVRVARSDYTDAVNLLDLQ